MAFSLKNRNLGQKDHASVNHNYDWLHSNNHSSKPFQIIIISGQSVYGQKTSLQTICFSKVRWLKKNLPFMANPKLKKKSSRHALSNLWWWPCTFRADGDADPNDDTDGDGDVDDDDEPLPPPIAIFFARIFFVHTMIHLNLWTFMRTNFWALPFSFSFCFSFFLYLSFLSLYFYFFIGKF